MDIFGNFQNLKGDKKFRKVDRRDELNFDYLAQDGNVEIKSERNKPDLKIFYIFILVVFSLLLGKLFINQVVMGKTLEKMAEGNKIRPRVIKANRGLIVDNQGVWLARNVPTFDLALYPSDLPKEEKERDMIYQQISQMIDISAEETKSRSEENGLLSLDLVLLKENLSHQEALLMEQKTADVAGVFVNKRASREYRGLPGVSHILGYTGKISETDLKNYPDYLFSDWLGKAGLEAYYESDLRGDDGVERIEVDSIGNIVKVLVDEKNRQPISGDNLTLYLDSDLQQKSYQYLLQGIEEAKKATGKEVDSGVVIAMNPSNGGILSMVSVPYYDNNLFSKGVDSDDYQNLLNDESKPMFNRAVSGTYPPGSIVKIVMATAGLSEGVISENTAFDTPSAIEIGEWRYPDWKDHGYTDIRRAIAESNNIFFYSIGGGFENIKGLGIERMKKWWQIFGLGEDSGIDLTAESAGLLPDPEWKERVLGEPWYLGDNYHVAIGQGDLLVTPLQMLRATSAVANGGKLVKPQLVQRVTNHNGEVIKEFGPAVQNVQIADPHIIQIVQQGMRMAVTQGSARILANLPVSSAGKTGTAQFSGNQKTHAWFECYAPYENPQIAVIVLVEGGGGGFEIAAPVAHNILEYYFTR